MECGSERTLSPSAAGLCVGLLLSLGLREIRLVLVLDSVQQHVTPEAPRVQGWLGMGGHRTPPPLMNA